MGKNTAGQTDQTPSVEEAVVDSPSFDGLLRDLARASDPPGLHACLALPPGCTLADGRLSIVRPLGQGGMVALDSGSPFHASLGLTLFGWTMAAERGAAAADEVAVLFARSEALAIQSGDPATLAVLSAARASAGQFLGDVGGPAVAQCERALELLSEWPDGWNLRCVVGFALHANSEISGQLRSVAELSCQVEDAFRRGHLSAAITFLHSTARSRLWQGDGPGYARQLEHARATWNAAQTSTFVGASLLAASVLQAQYNDGARAALEALQAAWPALERYGLLRVPCFHFELRSRRALAAFYCAQREPENRRALTALVRRDVRALQKQPLPFTQGPRQSLLGMQALLEHRLEDAAAHLRVAISASERIGWVPHAAAARYRLGVLLGGDEGTALIAEGRAALQRMGVTDVEAAVRIA